MKKLITICVVVLFVTSINAYAQTTEVAIDIKPGSFPNIINLKSQGLVPVAILTTDDFDAVLLVDVDSVRFGPDEAEPAHPGRIEDVDADGDLDLVLHFRIQEVGLAAGDTEATLTGQTNGGVPFAGTDSVKTVGG